MIKPSVYAEEISDSTRLMPDGEFSFRTLGSYDTVNVAGDTFYDVFKGAVTVKIKNGSSSLYLRKGDKTKKHTISIDTTSDGRQQTEYHAQLYALLDHHAVPMMYCTVY